MALEQTLSLIKPDGVSRHLIGNILAQFERNGLRIIAMKMLHLSKKEAEGFYAVHQEQPFFDDLTTMMSSKPIVALVLEGEEAVAKNREIMGATHPQDAAPGTIRQQYAVSIEENTVHGSDSLENAKIEINYFFSKTELMNQLG